MTSPRSAIATTGLRKSFGDHLVLDGIDIDVAEGTVFALLGPRRSIDEHHLLCPRRLRDDAAAQPAAHAPLPGCAAVSVGVPIVLLLLFVFVFGDTMGAGLAGASGGRGAYLDFITPGIVLIGVAGAAQAVAIAVAMDMAEGIVNRFRTMSISRASVLTGHGCAGSPSTSRSRRSWTRSAACSRRPLAGALGTCTRPYGRSVVRSWWDGRHPRMSCAG